MRCERMMFESSGVVLCFLWTTPVSRGLHGGTAGAPNDLAEQVRRVHPVHAFKLRDSLRVTRRERSGLAMELGRTRLLPDSVHHKHQVGHLTVVLLARLARQIGVHELDLVVLRPAPLQRWSLRLSITVHMRMQVRARRGWIEFRVVLRHRDVRCSLPAVHPRAWRPRRCRCRGNHSARGAGNRERRPSRARCRPGCGVVPAIHGCGVRERHRGVRGRE